MSPRLAGLVLAALAAGGTTDRVQVHVEGDRLSLETQGAPLGEVLDRLAAATGMKIVYDAPKPTRPVVVTLRSETPIAAVQSLLRGSGLAYAVRMDPAGRRIHTLVLSKEAAAGGGRAGKPRSYTGPVVYDEGTDPLIPVDTPVPTPEPTPEPQTPPPPPGMPPPGAIAPSASPTPDPDPTDAPSDES